MTSNQIRRILSGLNISTAKNEVLTIPYFRTIICETRRGIDGESDQLKIDYDASLIRIKDYYYKKVLHPLYPYEINGNEIKYISADRRITVDDVIIIADRSQNTLTKVGNVLSNLNFVITLNNNISFDKATQKMFFVEEAVYNESVPSPRNPLVLLKYDAASNNSVDTYININSIIAIDTFNASIDTSMV